MFFNDFVVVFFIGRGNLALGEICLCFFPKATFEPQSMWEHVKRSQIPKIEQNHPALMYAME